MASSWECLVSGPNPGHLVQKICRLGPAAEGRSVPRFVILEHDYPERHWDLMFEAGPVLKTWRLAGCPRPGGVAVEAEESFDHRPIYLDYEGPVSGGRGTVTRRDAGDFLG